MATTTPQTTYFGDVNVYGNTTMSGTLAVLGTPALFISNLGVSTDRFSAIGTQTTPFQYAWMTAANTTSVNFLTNIPEPVGVATSVAGATVTVQGNVQVSNSVSTTNVNVVTSINTGSVMNVNFVTGPGGVGVGTNVVGTAALAVLGTMNSVTSFQAANLILSGTLNVGSANIFSFGTSNIGVGTAPVTGGAALAVQGFASVSNAVSTTNVYVTTANVGTLNTGALVNSTGFFGFGTAAASGTTAYVLGDLKSSNAVSAPAMTSNGLIATGGINVATVVVRSNVGVGIAPVQGGSALSVSGNVFLSNAFTTPNVFAGSMNVTSLSNIVTGLATSNVLIGPAAYLYKGFNLAVDGNVVISNALQTTNVYAIRVNTATANTLSIAAPVGVGATAVWAYLPFNGTLADAAGGGNLTNPVGTGTLTYAVTGGPGGGPSLVATTGSYATWTVGTNAIAVDNGVTATLWFKFDETWSTGANGFFGIQSQSSPSYTLGVYTSTPNVIFRYIPISTENASVSYNPGGLVTGTWYHVAITVDGSTKTLTAYFNGVSRGTSTYTTGGGYLTTSAIIGGLNSSTTSTIKQQTEFADFRVYNAALTAQQIAAIYAQNAAALPTGYALQIQGNLYASNTATISTANTTQINASLNSNVVTLTATSNVGIGTTPVAGGPSLAVQGNLFVSNALTTTNVFATTSANTATLNTGSIFTTSSAFLGISTTDPSGTTLYVPGNVYASNALTTGTITVTNSNALASNVTTIYVSSNVGVGTAPVAGGAILAVQGNSFVSNSLETTNVSATTSANILTLNTGSIFTTATGFLGVGTSDPSGTALYVPGNVYASTDLTTTNVAATRMNVTGLANTTNFTMATGQFLGIGGATPTGNALEVSGNAFVSNAVTATNVFSTLANVGTLNTLSIFTRNSFLGVGTSAASGTSLFVPGNVYASTSTNTPAMFTPAASVSATGNALSVTSGTGFVVPTRYVAVVNGTSTAAYSNDGITWVAATMSVSATWQSVTVNPKTGRFVAIVTNSTAAAYSNDGIKWVATTTPSAVSWQAVTVNPNTGRFVAVAGITGSASAAYSNDGITWVATTLPASRGWHTVTCNPATGRFVTVATTTSSAAYSNDGITWVASTMPSVSSFEAVTCNPVTGRFVAVAQATSNAAYSNDGITWVAATMPSSVNWKSVTCNPTTGRFVAVAGATSNAAYSNDGINWIATTMPSSVNWFSVTVNPNTGRFVAIIYNVSAAAAYSDDGINWVASTMPSSANWQSVTAYYSVGAPSLSLLGNLYASNAVTTTNITATTANVTGVSNVTTLAQISAISLGVSAGGAALNVRGNVVASNSVTTTNVYAIRVNTATANTLSISAPVGVGAVVAVDTWAYLPFNGTLADAAGGGNLTSPVGTGTLTYAVTGGPGGGSCLSLATGSYVTYTMSSTAINLDATGGATLSFWMRLDSAYVSGSSWARIGTTGTAYGWYLSSWTSTAMDIYFTAADNSFARIIPSVIGAVGVWSHIVIVIDTTTKLMTAYKNGSVASFTNQSAYTGASAGYLKTSFNLASQVGGGTPIQQPTSFADVRVYDRALTAPQIAAIYAQNAAAPPTGYALQIQGNLYASNALTIGGDIAAASMNLASTLNVGSVTTQYIIVNSVEGVGPNIYIPTSITTTNVFATNVNAASFVGTSGSIGIGTTGGGYALRIEGNLTSSNTLWSLPDVSAPTSIYYVDDITKRSPHLLPAPSNAAAIQNWISATCNAASQTKAWWATSSVPAYGNVTARPGYSGGVYLPDGRALFVPSTTSTIGVYTQDSGLFSSIGGAAPGFSGGVLLPNGNVVFAPQFSNVGMFNPVSNKFSNIVTLSSNAYNAVLTSNGIAFTPLNTGTASVVLYNTTAVNVLTRAAALDASAPLQTGSALLPSGNVLFSGPLGSSNLMHFNPVTLALSNIAVGTSGYAGLVLGPNGNVVAVPSGSNAAVINPVTATSTNVATGGGFSGGVLLPSGKVIFIPRTAAVIGTLDPVTLAYSSFGNMSGFSGGTLLTSGQVVFAPETSVNVCVLETEVPVSQEFCASPYFNKL